MNATSASSLLVLLVALGAALVAGCSAGPVLPDLPPCPGPACTCTNPDDCTCASRSECALRCGDGCRFHCREDSTCAAACGNACNLECVEDTDCTLYAGDDSNVRCTASTCVVEIGARSAMNCRDRAMCEITCLGACTVACESGTTCRYRCGAGGPLVDGPGACE